MIDTTILTAAIILLAALLYFEKRESHWGILVTKPLVSALFVTFALAGAQRDPVYAGFVFAGLLFCLVGDIFLIFIASQKLFTAGLASFLIGHILYAVAFFATARPGMQAWIVGASVLAISSAVFAWLRPHLGRMLFPVFAYVVVITVMVFGASSLLGGERRGVSAGAVVFSGAVLFYCSDIFVARQRFVVNEYVNRLVGLPLYYVAQFMIAFSIRLL